MIPDLKWIMFRLGIMSNALANLAFHIFDAMDLCVKLFDLSVLVV